MILMTPTQVKELIEGELRLAEAMSGTERFVSETFIENNQSHLRLSEAPPEEKWSEKGVVLDQHLPWAKDVMDMLPDTALVQRAEVGPYPMIYVFEDVYALRLGQMSRIPYPETEPTFLPKQVRNDVR